MLQPWIHLADTIYLNTNENDRKANNIAVRDYRYITDDAQPLSTAPV